MKINDIIGINDNNGNGLSLADAALLVGEARKSGLTDDDAYVAADLQSQKNEITAEINSLKSQGIAPDPILEQRLALIEREQSALNASIRSAKMQRAREEQKARREDRKQSDVRLTGEQMAALEAMGIDPETYKIGENNDNQQQFPGEKGGRDRSRSFMRQVAQNWDDGEDPNRFQNFGGVVGLQDGNRAQVGSEDYFNEMMQGDNERGLTPYDVSRDRKQGTERRLPPDARGGKNNRPLDLFEFLESKYNFDTVDAPGGKRGGPAHQEVIDEKMLRAAKAAVANLYSEEFIQEWFKSNRGMDALLEETSKLQLQGFNEKIDKVEHLVQVNRDRKEKDTGVSAERRSKLTRDERVSLLNESRIRYLSDLMGEEWKNQDFGDGREIPAGLERRLIKGSFGSPNQMVKEQQAIRRKKANGRGYEDAVDAEGRRRFLRHDPGKVFGEEVFGINTKGEGQAIDLLNIANRDDLTDVQVMKILRKANPNISDQEIEVVFNQVRPLEKVINERNVPSPREQFWNQAQQQPGNARGAIINAIQELESQVNDPSNPLQLTDTISPENFSDPKIRENIEKLYGFPSVDLPASASNPAAEAVLRQRRQLNPGVVDPVLSVNGSNAPTVGKLIQNLKGSIDGGVLLEQDRREAQKARNVAERRARGEFTVEELNAEANRRANRAIAGPEETEPGYNARRIIAIEREARNENEVSLKLQDIEKEISSIDTKLSMLNASTPDGAIERERLRKKQNQKVAEYREVAIEQRFDPKYLAQVNLGREQKKNNKREFESFEDALNKGIAKEPAWFSGLSPEEARAKRAYIQDAQLNAVLLEAQEAEARGEIVRPIRQAANQAAAEVWPVRLAEAAVLREKEQRGGMLNNAQFDSVLNALNTEIMPNEEIYDLGWMPKREVGGRQFVPDIKASELVDIGSARPILDPNGVPVAFVDNSRADDSIDVWGNVNSVDRRPALLGNQNTAELRQLRKDANGDPIRNELGQVVEKWDRPENPSIRRAKAWIQSAVYDQYDERRIGEPPDLDWKGLQVGEALARVNGEVAKKLGVPTESVSIRNIEDFENSIDAVINSRDAFDVRDLPEGIPFNQAPGGNKRVRKADLPEELLFDAALQDMKIVGNDRKNLARAMDTLAKGMANVGPNGEQINAAQKAQWNAGRPNIIGTPSISQQQQIESINQQQYTGELGLDALNREAETVDQLNAQRVANEVRGVERLQRDADWNVFDNAKVGMYKRDRDGNIITRTVITPEGKIQKKESEGKPIKGLVKQLDVNKQVDAEVDLRIAEIEQELQGVIQTKDGLRPVLEELGRSSARVTPSERRAIRDRVFAEIVGPDIDQWMPGAQQPFQGAFGDAHPVMKGGVPQAPLPNRGGAVRRRPQDRHHLVRVNVNDSPEQVIAENARFPGNARNPQGAINPNGPAIADQANALRLLELQRNIQGPAEFNPTASQVREANQLGAANVNRAQAEVVGRDAKLRKPLSPADIINIERKSRARQNGEPEPTTFVPRGLDGGRNMQMGDPRGMERGVFGVFGGQEGVPEIVPMTKKQERAFNPGLIMDADGTIADPWARGAAPQPMRTNTATSAVTSQQGQGANVLDTRDIEKFASQARQKRDQTVSDPWTGSSAPATQGQEPIGQAPGVSSQRPTADNGVSNEKRKRKEAAKTSTNSSNVRPTERRFGDRARNVRNQVRDFATKPQYSQGRRIGYAVGGGALGAMGLDALIGGEREKREEQAVR